MQALDEKKTYFDEYWLAQSEAKTDPRSRQRAEYVMELLQKKSGRLLDVGCGRGLIMDYFGSRGFEVSGIDISPKAVHAVREKGYEAHLLDIEQEEFDGRYDIILCLEVLQQLHDPAKALTRLATIVEDGGELVVSLPNEFHIVSRLELLFGMSHIGDYRHSHIRLFSPARCEDLFREAGLMIVGRRFVPIIPPKWKFLSTMFKNPTELWPSFLALSLIYSLKKR
jgi:2-polyprenyl-3-methyl-5-hydroxy-6-metoxy-1,4-benzoquinol methylase